MGFARKLLFVGTGGTSRLLGIKTNSKEERIANAMDEQAKLAKAQRKMLDEQRQRDNRP